MPDATQIQYVFTAPSSPMQVLWWMEEFLHRIAVQSMVITMFCLQEFYLPEDLQTSGRNVCIIYRPRASCSGI